MRLARAGANVGLIDLKEEKAEKVKEEIENLGVKAIALDVDLSDPKRVEESIAAVVNEFGRLDIVFANAGINRVITPIEDFLPEERDHTLTTNLKSTFLTVKYSIHY